MGIEETPREKLHEADNQGKRKQTIVKVMNAEHDES